MAKNNYLILILILMALPFVNGLYAGIENPINDFGGCLGLYQVAVYGIGINESNYFFNRCQYRDRQIWNCPCDKNTNNVILTPATSEIGKTVTVGLQYRISENEADIRIKRFTNLIIQKNSIKTVPFWQMNKQTENMISIIIFVIAIGLSFGIIFVLMFFKNTFADEKTKEELDKEEKEIAEKYRKQ